MLYQNGSSFMLTEAKSHSPYITPANPMTHTKFTFSEKTRIPIAADTVKLAPVCKAVAITDPLSFILGKGMKKDTKHRQVSSWFIVISKQFH